MQLPPAVVLERSARIRKKSGGGYASPPLPPLPPPLPSLSPLLLPFPSPTTPPPFPPPEAGVQGEIF